MSDGRAYHHPAIDLRRLARSPARPFTTRPANIRAAANRRGVSLVELIMIGVILIILTAAIGPVVGRAADFVKRADVDRQVEVEQAMTDPVLTGHDAAVDRGTTLAAQSVQSRSRRAAEQELVHEPIAIFGGSTDTHIRDRRWNSYVVPEAPRWVSGHSAIEFLGFTHGASVRNCTMRDVNRAVLFHRFNRNRNNSIAPALKDVTIDGITIDGFRILNRGGSENTREAILVHGMVNKHGVTEAQNVCHNLTVRNVTMFDWVPGGPVLSIWKINLTGTTLIENIQAPKNDIQIALLPGQKAGRIVMRNVNVRQIILRLQDGATIDQFQSIELHNSPKLTVTDGKYLRGYGWRRRIDVDSLNQAKQILRDGWPK